MTFIVKNVHWSEEEHTLRKIREKVFVYGWRIPPEWEFDKLDEHAFHVLVANEEHSPVATGRITPDGEIGRIAVESKFRKKEVYSTLIGALLDIANELALNDVCVQCDLAGVELYQQQGFEAVGGVFMEAGTPRQRMRCDINAFSLPRIDLTH